MDEIAAWLSGRLPPEWFEGEPTVTVDREEVVVVGRIAAPDVDARARADLGADVGASEEGARGGASEASGGDGAATTAGAATAAADAVAVASAAEAGRTTRFREQTRAARMQVADEVEARFGRKVAWGVRCGGSEALFTSAAVPVMTRLRQPQRQVLDTLVGAGVARSRSEALAWCVSLVGQHQDDWIASLREALVGVETARAAGPRA